MRIGSRVALVHASVIAVFASAGSWAFLLSAERALDGEMSARTRTVARIAAQRIDASWLPSLERGDAPVRALASASLGDVAAASEKARIVLLDRDGRVLAASDARLPAGERYAGLVVDAREAASARAGEPAASAIYQGNGGTWYQSAWEPLGSNGDVLGAELEVRWRAPLERLRRAVLAFALAAAAVAAGVGIALSRGITRPLSRLADAMRDTGPDGLPRSAGVRGADEVGALGERFDALVEALRRHDRELRALSATVAHEVRNPLGAMNGYAELLARRAASDPEITRLTGGIREEVEILERLVGRFLRFAGEIRLRTAHVDLAELLDDSVRASLPPESAVRIERRYAAGPPIDADGDLLREVFVNLVRNAAQATKDAGHVTLSIERDARSVKVTVRDDGPGIAEEIRARLFEPFSTTKADGTGLGLAICRRIVTAHGGTIECESGVTGTAFVVTLPFEAPAGILAA